MSSSLLLSRIKALKPCDILILSTCGDQVANTISHSPQAAFRQLLMGALSYMDEIVKVNLKQPLFKRSDKTKVYSDMVVQTYRSVVVALSLPTRWFD